MATTIFFVLQYGTGDIRIQFGDGLGGFTPSGLIGGHGGAMSALVVDVNNDGVDDIVVHSRTIQPGSVDGISAFVNDGSGSFTRIDSIGGFTYLNLDGRQMLAAGDFNGDGNIDILAGGTTNTNGSVFPFFGDGTGNFTVQPRIETFQRPFSVQVGHFNTDGALDFMVQGRRCQTKMSGSPKPPIQRASGRKLTPFNERGSAVLFKNVSAVEVSFRVEVIVN